MPLTAPPLVAAGSRTRRLVAAGLAALLAPLTWIACQNPEATDSSRAQGEPSAAPEATRLELKVEPFPDFYFWTRAQAAGVVDVEPEFQPLVDAWMPVQDEVGAFGGFWVFDLAGMLSGSPEEFAAWFDDFDETMPSRSGGDIPIRGPGKAMATAMDTVWPRFLEQHWPERRALLLDTLERLEREFMPDHQPALQSMMTALAIEDPRIVLPAYLALETHPPGASTYRTRDGAAAILSTRELLSEGRFSDLAETLLHESTHALDGVARGDDDAFTKLRSRLEDRGIEPRSALHRSAPHLVMFVQAEETMRRTYDPEHVAYGTTQRGDIAPLYQREGEAAVIVRREWRRYLDGETDLDRTLDRIADLVADLASADADH